MKKFIQFLVFAITLFMTSGATAQSSGTCVESPIGSNHWIEPDGSPCRNSISTVVSFLRIVPDARTSGMGSVGLATSPDANAMHFNAAKLASSTKDGGLSMSYVPWLKGLGLNDIFMAYLTGYYKFSKKEAIAASIRYFSLGDFTFTDTQGNIIGYGKPNEFEIAVAYSRALGDKLFGALTGKFISSNLATGQQLNGVDIQTARTGAADISIFYRTPLKTNTKSNLALGVAITNLGGRISYTKASPVRDLLPANLGIGMAWDVDLDQYNRLTLGVDFNKLLVPSPDPALTDDNNNGVPDYREKALIPAIFGSFSDAAGGFKEELRECMFGIGAEYWYNDQFSIRAGYQYESPLKGNQKYFTLGLGLKYTTFGLNLSYLVPSGNTRTALDNTLRFTLMFDFGTFEVDDDPNIK
ncbi:MAG TPA: type IX secretion system outer membrane channel protein PorV [Saprospiraceae bacterium]|mgnify:FL=1|nr:type IX secretion system outer membrane channel protein PorV [Saprospiraceae bacterium]HMY83961.1 type IX secretion system outer membrane channel protein PorV [Saprospiraceae bacterium]HMZ24140.1 type IX secretion system outer membrane channel protein PorV [Saprospiraceae bacterium]HNA75592.1 type IX secretion system outer membrane channel protein PorV [Saprospiraceae bacterium]HNB91953.1 type IX secretion system outer membrane channel protein PorV [Saprospiraceae bacterium]